MKTSLNSILILAASLFYFNIAIAAPPVKVKVTSASPNSALQGDALPVVISGSGFDVGSTVKFLVTGSKDASQINVGAVVLNNDGTLTASIQVLNGATVTDYDIEVQTSSGRRGKGTTLFKVQSSGGGNEQPTFGVFIYGDMSGSGTLWNQHTSGDPNVAFFNYDEDPDPIGSGEIDLGYFTDDSGPFAPGRGANCFGADLSTQLIYGSVYKINSGAAVAMLQFIGTTEDGEITLEYGLKLEGLFDDPNDWTPLSVNTLRLTSWKLRIQKKLRKKLSNISCVGEGTFETFIDVVRNP